MATIRYGTIEGGHDGDPDPQKAGRVRVRDVAHHGEGVQREHLPFSQMLTTPSQFQSFNRPPLPGTLVAYYVPDGAGQTGYVHPIGIPIGIDNGQVKAIPGNDSEIAKLADIAKSLRVLINPPPNSKTSTSSNETGVSKVIKEIVEKGSSSGISLKDFDGLPTHAALFMLSGMRWNPIKGIATATASATNIPSADMLSQIINSVGSFFTLTNLTDLLTNDQFSEMTKNWPNEVKVSFDNMMKLIQTETTPSTSEAGWLATSAVNMATLGPQIVDSLKNVKTPGELFSAIEQVNQLAASSGKDLPKIKLDVETPFGNIEVEFDIFGNLTSSITEAVEAAKTAFNSFLTGIPGAGGTQQMFNEAKVTSLIERLKDTGLQAQLKQTLEKLKDTAYEVPRTTNLEQALAGIYDDLKQGFHIDEAGFRIDFKLA